LEDTEESMSEQNPPHELGSLEIVELIMAFEERHGLDLTLDQQELLAREIKTRIENGEFRDKDDFDDDALSALVLNRGPRTPRGQGEAAAIPDEPFLE
jgi:hypothetical protein